MITIKPHKMKRKVDFTIKGTKLPVIPKGQKYSDGTLVRYDKKRMVSFGLNINRDVLFECKSYKGWIYYTIPLSTIEALAEEQGMLWVEDETPKAQPDVIPSIEQILIDCVTLNNTIKTSCRLFESIDDEHKLDLMHDARVKLASKVSELNNILNPQPMQSVVEIAEASDKL